MLVARHPGVRRQDAGRDPGCGCAYARTASREEAGPDHAYAVSHHGAHGAHGERRHHADDTATSLNAEDAEKAENVDDEHDGNDKAESVVVLGVLCVERG
jgi:hypothetical protein